MADIAILVAEEYERRSRSFKKENEGEEIDHGSCILVLAQRVDAFSWIKKVGEEKFEIARKVFEPKSSFGLALVNGFFSA